MAQKSNDYEIRKNGQWQKLEGIAVRPAKPGEMLNGSHAHAESGGSLFADSDVYFSHLIFKPDGMYETISKSHYAKDNGAGESLNGRVERQLFYYRDASDQRISIDGWTYSRK